MYTNQQWIDMLKEVNSFAVHYESIEVCYSELKEKKRDLEDNTGAFVALVCVIAVIFAFVKFGWLKGLIALVVVCILYGAYDEMIVKKKVKNKLKDFEKENGENLRNLEIAMKDLKKQRNDMEASESYAACKNYLPSECMGSSWYRSYVTGRRIEILSALENGAETLEKAIELMQKSHG